MSNTGEVRRVACPSCGAPLEFSGSQGRCPFCGTVVERSEPVVQRPPGRVIDLTGRPDVRPRQRSCAPLLLVLGVLILGVAGVITWLSVRPKGGSAPQAKSVQRVSLSLAAVAPADRAGSPDLLVYTYQVKAQTYHLTYLDGATYAVRWDSPPLGEYSINPTAPGTALVYVTDENKQTRQQSLLALKREDGTLVWKAPLSDEVLSNCQGCLRALGNTVVALSRDGTVQAFEAQTGRLAWNHRLNYTADHMLVVKGWPAVVDQDAPKDWDNISLYIWDQVTGELAHRITPHCPDSPHPKALDIRSPVLVNSGGDTVYFLYGTLPACAERWDLTGSQMVWQMQYEDLYFDRYNAPPLLFDDAIYSGYDGEVIAISTADGRLRQLANEEDYELTPLDRWQGILIVSARRTRGSSRYELWGLDAATGEQRWRYLIQAEAKMGGPSSGGSWAARLTSRGLVVLQVLPEPPRAVLETVDPRTGVGGGQVSASLEDADLESVVWSDDAAWLEVRTLVAVELATGKILFTWP